MFEGFLLVCSLLPNAEPPCVELHDTQGPYKTVEECQARVADMLPELPKMFFPPYTVSYKCEKNVGV